jgi:hypothetical protein
VLLLLKMAGTEMTVTATGNNAWIASPPLSPLESGRVSP